MFLFSVTAGLQYLDSFKIFYHYLWFSRFYHYLCLDFYSNLFTFTQQTDGVISLLIICILRVLGYIFQELIFIIITFLLLVLFNMNVNVNVNL